MDNKGLLRLQKLKTLNADPNWENKDLYRLMYMEELYIIAYEKIKSEPGNMTAGADNKTIDGFSMSTINNTIRKMKDQSFDFTRARRMHIPKANGKTRPLGIPSPKDKIVQEVIRMILECIYDGSTPTFSERSHGFRDGRGTHSCLQVVRSWNAVSWFIEGDIKGCFDNVDHHVLMDILKRRIKDQRFLDLIWKTLRAGYMEGNIHHNSIIGTPQGSIVSPILANIYLHEFDMWVEDWIANHEKSQRKRTNPEYTYYVKELNRIKNGKKRVSPERYAELVKGKLHTPSLMHNDPEHIRVVYVRYADDWLTAIDGPRHLAEKFKAEATEFFLGKLKLELSDEKTAIRNARKEEAVFLGTSITIGSGDNIVQRSLPPRGKTLIKRRTNTAHLTYMRMPTEKILKRLRENGFIDGTNQPQARRAWINKEDWEIVEAYNGIIRGYRNYYSFVDNPRSLHYLQYLLQYSCAKTLCNQKRISLRKLFRKHGVGCKVPKKWDKDGKVIKFSELALQRSFKKNRMDFKCGKGPSDQVTLGIKYLTRTKLDEDCVICGETEGIQMHHVKHLRKDKAKGFTRILQAINRKQVPVCHKCHVGIHIGSYDGISIKDLANPAVARK
ncbi:MAG: reverse transcriptase domain-containing protein [Marivita sp.]|uniref:reverse transcriptase domain-containing protein n=1 Tax=Marivita sp. TaxID=2003365 RepID=UPI0025C471A7|nr:reverse transcriptase domain-containing protein [Marivita sp.]MCI5108935.1 reverse transcriptase domain-containing protein [Marivita sp.]